MSVRPRIALIGRFTNTASALRYGGVVSSRALLESLWDAGADPVTLLPAAESDWKQRLQGYQGVLLAGGGDINPARYGQEPDASVYDVVSINLTAVFLMCREAVKAMKAQTPQGGRIINMGSVSAKTPRPDSIAYTATKHAIQGMTHQLTMDGRKYGVVASIIHPGATLSSFTSRRGRTQAGAGATPDDYVMSAADVARVAVLMATLPPEVNLYEATILPNQMRSFIGRG